MAYLLHQLGTHIDPLTVHLVLMKIVHPHRLERPRADMQRHMPKLHATLAQSGQQGIIKMQARGGGSHRTNLASKHGLVALGIIRTGFALDIRRQRHPPGVLQPILQRLPNVETQTPETGLIALQHLRLTAGIECNFAADPRRFADPQLRTRFIVRQQPLDQEFDTSTAGLVAKQTRRNHPGVVENQQVARAQQQGQITHLLVGKRAAIRRHQQQATGRALRQGHLRDQFGRQVKMEIGLLQGNSQRQGNRLL